jgi:hypothetical protein
MKMQSCCGKKYICVFLLILGVVLPWLGHAADGQGLSVLSEKAADAILGYFSNQYNIQAAVIKFENTARVSALTAQRFYQLLVARLETSGNFNYIDLMINFHQDRGEFNLNRIQDLNHLIYLKLTRNRDKIGAGITIFSRVLDRIVFIKYIEEPFAAEERDLFTTTFGFQGTGFARIMEMEAKRHLLDVRSFLDRSGQLQLLFFYPEEIEFYKLEANQLQRVFSYPLQWGTPYYPAREPEGKLSVFYQAGQLVVTAGANFSPAARVLWIDTGEAEEVTAVDSVDFVPFRQIRLNNQPYLAGARYAPGKNYFQGQCVLLPLEGTAGQLVKEKYFVKAVPAFYSLDYSTTGSESILNSVHLVDRDYRYRFLGDNFEELTVDAAERGSALCCLEDHWLAISDFSHFNDRLFFYALEKGQRRLVYQNNVAGEIVFISDGLWKAAPGFWVYIRQRKPNTSQYKLQFWSKKSE